MIAALRFTRRLPLIILSLFVVALASARFFASSAVIADEAAKPANENEIVTWTAVLVDEKTTQPLPGILVDVQIAVTGKSELQPRVLQSDVDGKVEIPLRKGQGIFLYVRGPEWCMAAGWPLVGDWPDESQASIVPRNPELPIEIKLYRGTDVRGRLLLPDGQPAKGIALSVATHCNQTPWVSEEYIHEMMRVTYSVTNSPNWHSRTTTLDDGTFSVTVPPKSVRHWLRLGTVSAFQNTIDTSWIEKNDKSHVLVQYAPLEVEINGDDHSLHFDESTGALDVGDLRLSKGVVLRGKVLDDLGQPLAGVQLFTSSPRGSYAGRRTVSREDGTYEFMPMVEGSFELSPDAHLRNATGGQASNDVQAVFVPQKVTLAADKNPHELDIEALPYIQLEFEWIDRRANKGPVSYYGGFSLSGFVPRDNGSKSYWHGQTTKLVRDGKECLIVKVPEAVAELTLYLADSTVLATYEDAAGKTATDRLELKDFKQSMRRVIYGDEPPNKN